MSLALNIGVSGYINKHIHILVLPRQVVLFHQTVDALLDARDVRQEVLLDSLNSRCLELLVVQLFLALHDTHDRRVQGELAIAFNKSLCALRLLRLERKGIVRPD